MLTPQEERHLDEQFILGVLLSWPQANAWELSGITPGLFRDPAHRLIATALCHVRDSGRRVHWKRVRMLLKKRGHACHLDVDRLQCMVGTGLGLTAAISRLHYATARAA